MSLDVYLIGPKTTTLCVCPNCDHRHERETSGCYFDANITHNLGAMANEAGLYKLLWRPEELGIERASQLISPLRDGLARLRARPAFYRTFEPENEWGTYDDFLPWIEKYIQACEEYPDARIEVSR